MRLFTKEAWSYAILLIILFAIATLAVWHTISFLEDHIPAEEYRVATGLIWALTLGFMLIAGAFGLWAIQFSAEAESRRRIGRFVDAMDYLRDGLLAVDRKGRITGSNPTVRSMVKSGLAKHESIRDVFTCLSEEDVTLLLNTKEPNEVERKLISADTSRTLRFRSQPSEDLTLIMISDVTAMDTQRLRSRQVARLQLIGQIARGVAHDFTNLLCGVSGHASLLARIEPGAAEMDRSLEAITRSAERGIALAAHLMELAQSGVTGRSTDAIGQHVRTAVEMLRDSLPAGWQVECTVQDKLPVVALTGIQIEQVVLNLGLLAADALNNTAGLLKVSAAKPGTTHLFNVGNKFAGAILITATAPGATPMTSETVVQETTVESGVMQSVIRSMLEEAGGGLDCLVDADGSPIYRVNLPHALVVGTEDTGKLPDELRAYIAHWTILLARPDRVHDLLDKRLNELSVNVQRVDNIISALAHIEEGKNLDAMILDKYLLGQEAKGLLKAILKLRPSAGIVVLCEDPESESQGLSTDIVFQSAQSDPDKIITCMIEAKSLAVRRKRK